MADVLSTARVEAPGALKAAWLHPVRRAVGRVLGGIVLASLACSAGFGQNQSQGQSAPQHGFPDDPPPIEQLLPREPLGAGEPATRPDWLRPSTPSVQTRVWCRGGDTSCADLVGSGGNRIYHTMRRCWQPPMPARITTSIWFGDEATAPKSTDPGKTTILVQFGLNRNGTLTAPARSAVPNLSAAAKAETEQVIRAIARCQPYDTLADAKYDQWKNVLLRIVIEQSPDALR